MGAAKALTLFSPLHLDPQSEHCFAVSIQSTSQVSAAAVSSHSPVCGMCSRREGWELWELQGGKRRVGDALNCKDSVLRSFMWERECNKKSVSLKACGDVWRAISSSVCSMHAEGTGTA